jgi:hypothetical protein
MWYLALQRDGQLKRRAVHGCKWNLKACSEHGSVSMGEGGAGGVEGGVEGGFDRFHCGVGGKKQSGKK